MRRGRLEEDPIVVMITVIDTFQLLVGGRRLTRGDAALQLQEVPA